MHASETWLSRLLVHGVNSQGQNPYAKNKRTQKRRTRIPETELIVLPGGE